MTTKSEILSKLLDALNTTPQDQQYCVVDLAIHNKNGYTYQAGTVNQIRVDINAIHQLNLARVDDYFEPMKSFFIGHSKHRFTDHALTWDTDQSRSQLETHLKTALKSDSESAPKPKP